MTDDGEVGYKRPPKHSQFKKGQSGNPRGRPRGRKHVEWEPYERVKLLMLQEAYRLVEIKEGGKTIFLPLIQVMIRKMGVLAAQGNSRARRDYMDLLSLIEEEKSASYQVYQKKLFDYKMDVGEEYERRKKLNPSEPAPLPHPDDIIINPVTGKITLCGPMTKEEEVWWNRIEASEAAITELQALLAEDPTNEFIKKDIAYERKVQKHLALLVPDYRPRPSRRKQREAERIRAFRRKLAELNHAGEPPQTDGSTPPSPKPTRRRGRRKGSGVAQPTMGSSASASAPNSTATVKQRG
jgi:Family of unknown function (DUF5681)